MLVFGILYVVIGIIVGIWLWHTSRCVLGEFGEENNKYSLGATIVIVAASSIAWPITLFGTAVLIVIAKIEDWP